MNLFKYFIFIISGVDISSLYAMAPPKVQQFVVQKEWSFVANKGQLADQSGQRMDEIKYYGRQGPVNLYCRPGMISFVFTKIGNVSDEISEASGLVSHPLSKERVIFETMKNRQSTPSNFTTNRVDLVIVNANPNATMLATDQQEYYENFYLANTPEAGINGAHTYKTIVYKNIYPHIDMALHSLKNGLKYEFVVYPGGRVANIRLQWNGMKDIKLRANGSIHYSLGSGTITETPPFSYLKSELSNQAGSVAAAINKMPCIPSKFLKNGNTVAFKIGHYNRSKTLVIDPALVWATYYGGSEPSTITAQAVTTDDSDNVFITGVVPSALNIASKGAYQTTYMGSDEVFLAKFNAAGLELWSTYYGGTGDDRSSAIATDHTGAVYISGDTRSRSGIATAGAFQTSYQINSNSTAAFIAKFSSSGSRIWGSYFRGNIGEIGFGITTDAEGNVIMTGSAYSSDLATSGVYQTKLNGGLDAFIVKFTSTGNRAWCTYFGGNTTVYCTAITTDRAGNIFITGDTDSDSGIASPGATQPTKNGPDNAFVAAFSVTGNRLWSTYFGGNNADRGYGIVTDNSGNVYIAGETFSNAGIASAGAYQTKFGGNDEDGFVAKFSATGTKLWSTYFGGNDIDRAYGIAMDAVANKVYITGFTASTKGIASTGAYQTKMINGDAFVASFYPDGKLAYSSYYGGDKGAFGFKIATDTRHNVYLTGETGSTNMATRGAFQTANDSGNAVFLAKFDFKYVNDAGVSSFPSLIDTICPGNQTISVRLQNYGNHILNSTIINWRLNGKLQNPLSWKGSLKPDSSAIITLGNETFSLGKDSIVAWTSYPNGVPDSLPQDDTAKLFFKVVVPDAHWKTKNAGGGEQIFIAKDSIYPGSNYQWDFGDGTTGTGSPVSHTYNANNKYLVHLAVTNHQGCVNTFDSLIPVVSKVDVSIFPNPFSVHTIFSIKIPYSVKVRISIIDALGREICTLTDKKYDEGQFTIAFDGGEFKTLPGIYLANIVIDGKVMIRKIIQLDSINY
jgi:chitodextrinase